MSEANTKIGELILRLRGVSKQFGAVTALSDTRARLWRWLVTMARASQLW